MRWKWYPGELESIWAFAKPFHKLISSATALASILTSVVLVFSLAPVAVALAYPRIEWLSWLVWFETFISEQPFLGILALLSLAYFRPIVAQSVTKRAQERILLLLVAENLKSGSPYFRMPLQLKKQFKIVYFIKSAFQSAFLMLTIAGIGFFFGAVWPAVINLIYCTIWVSGFGLLVYFFRRLDQSETVSDSGIEIRPGKLKTQFLQVRRLLNRPSKFLRQTWAVELVSYLLVLVLTGAWLIYGYQPSSQGADYAVFSILCIGLSMRNAQILKAASIGLAKLLSRINDVEEDEEEDEDGAYVART